MVGERFRSMLDSTLRKRKVQYLSIRMRKVKYPSYLDEKGMTIIVNSLNISLFQSYLQLLLHR